MRGLSPHDAAVTGLGWITSLGGGVESTWQALRAGRRGFTLREALTAPEGTRWAAAIERPWLRVPVPEEQESQAKFLNVSGELLATAVHEATTQAGLLTGSVPPQARGLYVGQTDFSRAQCVDFRPAVFEATQGLTRPLAAEALNAASLHRVNPFVLLETLHNNAFSFVSAVFGLKGANATLSGFEGPGLAALSLAARAVATRRVLAAVGVGAGAASGGALRHELHSLGLTAPGEAAQAGVYPLDRRRKGLVPGDAAGAVVFEPLSVARTRGPGPFVVVLGQASGTGVPPPGAFAPPPETVVHVARQALLEAGLRVQELLGVVVPASGRQLEDRILLEAVTEVLGGAPVPVTAVAGGVGHAAAGLDASGVLAAVLSLRDGALPACIGYSEPEPGFEGLQVAQAAASGPGQAVLTLALGFDGQVHALALARVR